MTDRKAKTATKAECCLEIPGCTGGFFPPPAVSYRCQPIEDGIVRVLSDAADSYVQKAAAVTPPRKSTRSARESKDWSIMLHRG
jgi:hypothetical protein